ncbi:sensor histidine kinase [Actinomadura flavalba]|uniref:sensor histidine kinase n=1 Tax=Actinomadura flavalba TaxID=1120938 RepID=UPI000361FC97|nr:sensor histidine kinase [Actinomadura flavalba]
MTLTHRAFLYTGREEFLAGTTAFLRDGLERGAAAVAVARPENVAALRAALAEHDGAVEFYDATEFYRHPVRTLKSYLDLVERLAPQRVHAVAEPVWDGHDAERRAEWIRYESLINEVFADTGASALCPYDRRTLPAEVLASTRVTHPVVIDGAERRSPDYVAPRAFGERRERARRVERPPGAEYLPIVSDDLRPLRSFVAARARAGGLPETAVRNLVTAANEVAANALAHGSPPMGAWVWNDDGEINCEIGDNGHWRPDPLTGFVPPKSALDTGFGLWTVRLLVDYVEMRGGWDGTFVRLRICR